MRYALLLIVLVTASAHAQGRAAIRQSARTQPTVLTVKTDGTGDYTTIQACANAVAAGQMCRVYPGTYAEYVTTATAGTAAQRITFDALGVVTTKGFAINHAYVTVRGFDLTGFATAFSGTFTIGVNGDYCHLAGNTLRDGAANVFGVTFTQSGTDAAVGCAIYGNTLTNLEYMFFNTAGTAHTFERNTLEINNGWDFIRLFGSNLTFRRNVFRLGTTEADNSNHPDFVQTFGTNDTNGSQHHLFEENWIEGLDGQSGQLDAGAISTVHEPYANYTTITFRRNVFANVSLNFNIQFPYATLEHNTFYRQAYSLTGISATGSITRGSVSNMTLKHNVFLAGGNGSNQFGFYGFTGAVFNKEVIAIFITEELQTGATTVGIFNDLVANLYIDTNGKILAATTALADISGFTLNAAYDAYKQEVYDRLIQARTMNTDALDTLTVDYNYAGGASPTFTAKRSDQCGALPVTAFNFCEDNGVNGGDPKLTSLSNLLGADGVPFTLDDGLKPAADSPLCAAGEGGADIGAYSCSVTEVFAR